MYNELAGMWDKTGGVLA